MQDHVTEERMTEMILSIEALPEVIISKISTSKVKLIDDNGVLTITALKEEKPHRINLRGIFKNNKLGVEEFLAERKKDLDLEEENLKITNKKI